MGAGITNKSSGCPEPPLDKKGPALVTKEPVVREQPYDEETAIVEGELQAREEQEQGEGQQHGEAIHQGQPVAPEKELRLEILIFI